jgi:hypothetical protein
MQIIHNITISAPPIKIDEDEVIMDTPKHTNLIVLHLSAFFVLATLAIHHFSNVSVSLPSGCDPHGCGFSL